MGNNESNLPNIAWLENPEIFAVNRLPAHSDHQFYASMEDFHHQHDSLKQSLNGIWKFHWSSKPEERPSDFMKPDYDLAAFDDIAVPGHIELAGYGQIQYTNTAYPWDGHTFLRPPHIDWNDNPVGSYVREFDLNDSLIGKRVCLSFQGAEQAIYVWLNGTFVGYSEDSFTPSDFDITSFVKPKGNRLCVELYKRSSAAWIEDQDFFRFSGLFREVFLYGKPQGHVEDLKILADYDVQTHKGTFSVEAMLSGSAWAQVICELTDDEEKCIFHKTYGRDKDSDKNSGGKILTGNIILPDIRPWNVKKPYLYKLLLKVADSEGHVLEVVPYKIGFRRFEIQDKIMLLNGERLLINGVNRHEWNPRRGRSIATQDMETDIAIMKRNGINAVRTSHYPNQSLWYQLCDEAGICVMDETNLESHGTCMKLGVTETSWNIPGSEPSWEACCLDRAKSMYERDKNHACILWWSAGNESHVGTVIQKMCDYFRAQDPGRLVHYEAVFYDRSFDFITDVESQMYPTPKKVREYLTNNPAKPMLLCEYMHDMGNSLGGLASYMQIRDEFPSFQGGFLWDFIDQALYMRLPGSEEQEMLGYGGDFKDRPTDYAFCANGLLFADRREKPAMQEVRYWYLSKDEQKQHDRANEETMELARFKAQEEIGQYSDESETAINRLFVVPSGVSGSSGIAAETGNEESAAASNAHKTDKETMLPCLKVIHTDFNLGIYGEGFHYVFSFGEGGPVSLIVNGREQLYRAPRPAFWRAPTENDIGCGFPTESAQWLGADRYSRARECVVEEIGDGFVETLVPLHFAERRPAREDIREVEIKYTFETATTPKTTVTVVYRVNAYGRIRVFMHYKGNTQLPDLPEFGLRLLTEQPIESFTWEGLSGETYPDRCKGAAFGTHSDNPKISDYLVPQECGNHKDTVRMEAGDLVFLMDENPYHFSILPYLPQELDIAFHKEELPVSRRSVITVLGKIRGVGGIDSWGNDVEEAYHISGQEDIRFSFYIVPRRKK